MCDISDIALLRCVTLHELPHLALFNIQVVFSQSNHDLQVAGPIEMHERASPEYVYLEASVADHVI